MIHKTILKINLLIRYVSSIEGGFWCHAGCVWSMSRVGIRKILYTHDFESGAEGGRGGCESTVVSCALDRQTKRFEVVHTPEIDRHFRFSIIITSWCYCCLLLLCVILCVNMVRYTLDWQTSLSIQSKLLFHYSIFWSSCGGKGGGGGGRNSLGGVQNGQTDRHPFRVNTSINSFYYYFM